MGELQHEAFQHPRAAERTKCGSSHNGPASEAPQALGVDSRHEAVWNRTKKRDPLGHQHPQARPETEWVEVEVPHLRLVPETLWQSVQRRRAARRARYFEATRGRRHGRPPRDVDSKYLLPGFARGCCRRA